MNRPHRILVALAVLMAAFAVFASAAAAATPEQVAADASDNGIVDGRYEPAELAAAIQYAQERGGPLEMQTIGALRDAQSQALFDVHPSGAQPQGDEGPGLELPQAPVTVPGTSIPVPFLVLSVLAVLLVIAGGATSAFRRISRQ